VLFNQWEHSLADADAVHHFSAQGGTYNLCAYARNHGIPLVVSPILWLSDYVDQYPMEEIGLITSFADAICPNSEAEVERFLSHFPEPREKYCVTYNGIDSLFFKLVSPDLFRTRFQVPEQFVLCVGNIEPRKNQLKLLEAASSLNVHVVLIGNVRDAEYFSTLSDRFAGEVTYLGYLDHDSDLLRSAYSACSVFALPSLLETPGLAALEAAASGSQLVITSEGCTEEYFGSGALYVDPLCASSIAEGLENALSGRHEGVDKFKTYVQKFTWDNTAIQLEEAYSIARTNLQKN